MMSYVLTDPEAVTIARTMCETAADPGRFNGLFSKSQLTYGPGYLDWSATFQLSSLTVGTKNDLEAWMRDNRIEWTFEFSMDSIDVTAIGSSAIQRVPAFYRVLLDVRRVFTSTVTELMDNNRRLFDPAFVPDAVATVEILDNPRSMYDVRPDVEAAMGVLWKPWERV